MPISLRSDRGSHQTSTDKVQAMYHPCFPKVKVPLSLRKRAKYPLHSNFRRWWFWAKKGDQILKWQSFWSSVRATRVTRWIGPPDHFLFLLDLKVQISATQVDLKRPQTGWNCCSQGWLQIRSYGWSNRCHFCPFSAPPPSPSPEQQCNAGDKKSVPLQRRVISALRWVLMSRMHLQMPELSTDHW